MSNRIMKYARGTVWWLSKAGNNTSSGSSVQAKPRPVVIVSNDDRGRSSVLEVCMITSTDKSTTCRDINVGYINSDGHKNYIECNQHFTVGTHQLSRFLGVLPDDVMNKVDNGLLISQGMSHLADCNRTISHLKSQIAKTQALTSNLKEMDVLKLEINATLANINEVLQSSLLRTERIENNLRENMETRAAKNIPEKGALSLPKPAEKKHRSKRTKMTLQEMREFLCEYQATKNKSDMAEKYNMTVKQLYPKVSYIKRVLKQSSSKSSGCVESTPEDSGSG